MATIKFLNAAGKYADDYARESVISYIMQPAKTPNHLIGGLNVDMQNPAQSMRDVATFHGKDSRIRIRHFVVSFFPNEVPNIMVLQKIAEKVCAYIGAYYQIVYAVHEDTANPHIHFVFNPISFINGFRFRSDKRGYYLILKYVRHSLYPCNVFSLIPIKYCPDVNFPNE